MKCDEKLDYYVNNCLSDTFYCSCTIYGKPRCRCIRTSNVRYKLVFCFRKIALVVIFTRAGLDLDPAALKKLYCRVLILALVPWFFEAAVIAVIVHYLLSIPWPFAVLCGYRISSRISIIIGNHTREDFFTDLVRRIKSLGPRWVLGRYL